MSTALIPAPPQGAEFLTLYNRLCVALRESPDDSGITQGIYWDALKDLPAPGLEAGALSLMREPGRRFFPTTAEWRTAAERAQMQQLRDAVKPGRDVPWQHECEACEDTGWRLQTCDGGAEQWPEALPAATNIGKGKPWLYKAQERATEAPEASVCGRRKSHQPHTFATVCPCRSSNRTYQRHQHFGAGE